MAVMMTLAMFTMAVSAVANWLTIESDRVRIPLTTSSLIQLLNQFAFMLIQVV